MKKWHIAFWVILFSAISIWYVTKGYHSGPKEGSQAPEFSLPNASGQTQSLSQFSNQVILLNFWATWCSPCVSEMASLDHLYQKYKDKGFVVLAVSVDEEGWKAINEFLKKIPVTFPILLDSEFKVADFYGTYQVPESYLINRKGQIVDKILGAKEWDSPEMISKIEKIISNP